MKIAVIQGGPSAEAEVSRKSAAGVAAALQQAGHEPHRLELDAALATKLLGGDFDVVFPVTHGKLGEDGCLQGLLEIIELPYVGSGVLASALAADKVHAKRVFRVHGLPVADELVITRQHDRAATLGKLRSVFSAGVAVKPATQGSAIGVSLVDNTTDDALCAALDEAFRYDDVVLCEKLLRGREMTCGVLDVPSQGGVRALPVTEIFSKAAGWYDFKSKYAAGGSVHQCPADLPETIGERVQRIACEAHVALGCRDLSRVDFVVGDRDDPRTITVLEINVLPGMTATSLYPEAAAAAGIAFPALCERFVRAAVARHPVRRFVEALPMP
ncbi:MAG: D-alanine--D-alanine ligase [Polyangiaceae bacterium]|jgi:D-alanine-D-alanine ligase|nr:D-alanine--D-alanine ligase [Polyangiaceae bacterium]